MAFVTLNVEKLRDNYNYLDAIFEERDITWSVVTKLLCGNHKYLQVLADLGVKQCCDSRIANLRFIKSQFPDIETVFIKPPAKRNAFKVVEYADISFNTSFETLKSLSEAAVTLNKKHKVILMVELGELREGIMQKDLSILYGKVLQLANIEIVGLGTNLTCMYGILPSREKLQQLINLKDKIARQYSTDLPIISGGASVTIPLIFKDELPAEVNHFRIGETLFLGTDVYNNATMRHMQQDVFTLHAEIIELEEKPNIPFGEYGYNLKGEKKEVSPVSRQEISYRAILDIGLLDVDPKYLTPFDSSIQVAGVSSDMTVVNLGINNNKYKVGDKISFSMDYMGILGVMNSKYIDKKLHGDLSPETILAHNVYVGNTL